MLWTRITSYIEYLWRRGKLMKDRNAFDEFVYTDVDEAIKLFHQRKNDEKLQERVRKFFGKLSLPEAFCDPKGRLLLFRHVATPNIETSRFLIAADAIGIEPLFFEYPGDKFTPNNTTKRYLGKLAFYQGTGKKGGHIVEYLKIIDFNQSNGKKISEVKTISGSDLSTFHHNLFPLQGHNHIENKHFFDATTLLKQFGGKAEKYYRNYVGLFISNCILFENFVLQDESERFFTEKIFLRYFIEVKNYFKVKPLIVAISPTHIEHEEFWSCYNHHIKSKIDKILIQ